MSVLNICYLHILVIIYSSKHITFSVSCIVQPSLLSYNINTMSAQQYIYLFKFEKCYSR